MSCDYRDPCSCGYHDPDPEATKRFRERFSVLLALAAEMPAARPSLVFAPAVDEAWAKHMKHLQTLGEETYRRKRR